MKNDRGVPFWLDRELMISFDRVSSDMNVDVAIIGAGIVGLHAACQLRQSGLRVAIFEARKIGRQATGRSTDLAGRFLLTNAAFENMADRSAEDLKRLGRHELINPQDAEAIIERFNRAARDGEPFEAEYRLLRGNGTSVWVHDAVSVLTEADRGANRVISVTQEIDKRKRAEEQSWVNSINV